MIIKPIKPIYFMNSKRIRELLNSKGYPLSTHKAGKSARRIRLIYGLDKYFSNHKNNIGFYYDSKSDVCIYDPKDVDYLLDMWNFTHDREFIHNLAQGLMR